MINLSWATISYTLENFNKFEAHDGAGNLFDKIKILNDTLREFGFDTDLMGKDKFDVDTAGKNRDTFLGALKPGDYVGTILPQGAAPLPN